MKSMNGDARSGFTLVELLVVITIIGVLVALLLPAVQSARESGRLVQCTNNLKQLGLGAQQHLEALGFYPTGGWGGDWVGDPTRGFGRKQPGGWCYNVLPFIEMSVLHDQGANVSDPTGVGARKAANLPQVQTPLAMFICPTRRRCELYPFYNRTIYNLKSDAVTKCNKTDYAANVGDVGACEKDGLANSLTAADAKAESSWPAPSGWTGVTFCHSECRGNQVPDGASNTLLYGEKELDANHYRDSQVACDNHTMMLGFDNDTCRSSSQAPAPDRLGFSSTSLFGSAHFVGCNFVFCDGSVHLIRYSIDLATFNCLGSKNDRLPIDAAKL
jgi:prepilin-type N-terminal cleavage/methylation domain-containing protein/prepilin-type processing-associated H-X9-DG protein